MEFTVDFQHIEFGPILSTPASTGASNYLGVMTTIKSRPGSTSALPLLFIPLCLGGLAYLKRSQPSELEAAKQAVATRYHLIGRCVVGDSYSRVLRVLKGARVVSHRIGSRVTVHAIWPDSQGMASFNEGRLAFASERQRSKEGSTYSFLDLENPLSPTVFSSLTKAE